MDWRFFTGIEYKFKGKAKTSNALSDQFRQFKPQGQPSQPSHTTRQTQVSVMTQYNLNNFVDINEIPYFIIIIMLYYSVYYI